MSKMLRATSALSAVAIATLIAGCANPMNRAYSASGAAPASGTVGAATRAQLALASGDYSAAVNWAEQAVTNSPRDGLLRVLLGNAYLASGRFASAEAAYNDALTIAPNQPSVALKLVLAQIGQGKNEQAVQQLDSLRGSVDPADIGLAMALAGQPGNAVALLDEAARQPGADSRTRQNLALAHALAGDWAMAKIIAAQDLPADQVDTRVAEWMSMAKPSSSSVKLASVLGITPAAADPGQPVRLALQETATRLAAGPSIPAAPSVTVPLSPAPEPQLASVSATVMDNPGFAVPVTSAPSAPAEEMAEPAPALSSSAPVALADAAETLESIRREPVRASGALPKVAQLRRSAAARFARSGVVVQLGAYGSPKRVQAAWSAIARRHASLSRYTPASARFQAASGTVYRLSLKGFASDREARVLCEQLKRSGSACFVRNQAGDTAVRLAAR